MCMFLWKSKVYGVWNRIHSANGQQTAMPRLSQFDRARAIGTLEAGMSARDVAAHLQVHESTISRLRFYIKTCVSFFVKYTNKIHVG